MSDVGSDAERYAWVADSGLFIACGRQQNNKYTALRRFAQRNGISFMIPQRVYSELGGAPNRSTPSQTPINSAIDAGWVTTADELDYTNGGVAAVMDTVRRFIAKASHRSEDQIEKADTALAGVAMQLLNSGNAASVTVVTRDTDAGKGVVRAIEARGFEGQIEFKNGFDLIEEIT
ncbi:hypothetical protein A4G99_19430 [Haladaptatus sp. R4]|uniref:hypothetical protein n=1 Tax=Haladaptatus sp. R4 TaxID=1679489 RepID=UPI0007B4D734|nr:hypothetical protein [Haladaptatus sp. R4]KZN22630.1 hypothetical protein A4G99_19430 [Haladaptatus sp. R4]